MEPKGRLPQRLAEFPDRIARLIPRGGIASLTEGIEFISVWRWARLSLLVGVVVGLAAAGVYYVLEWGDAALFRRLGGVEQPPFGVGERLFDYSLGEWRWWLVLLLPAAGGLAAGLVIWKFAPETAGAGVNPVIDAYHNKEGRMRARVPGVKLVATLFSLGTGGSGGREGPMAMIGAGFGSQVATRLGLSAKERRLLLLAGAAGGIAALFRAPLGAALWSLEVLYRNDFESEGLFPCLVSSVTAYSVFTTIFGEGSLFIVNTTYHFDPRQLVFYAALAVGLAPFAVLWIKLLHVSEMRFWQPSALPAWLKPAVGGLLLGAFCLVVPWVFGAGYGWMQDALRPMSDPNRLLPIGYAGFGLLLGIGCAKMLATSLTVSSGGSAGVFAPSLFIGGFIGGAFGLLFHQVSPEVVDQPAAFVLVGMGAFYAGIGRVPIATIILISELFGSYDLLVPLMFSEMITLLLLRRFTLYGRQVDSALESPAHVAEFTVDVLEDMKVADHYSAGRCAEPISASMSLTTFLERVSHTADSFSVVRDPQGELVGMISLANIRSVVAEQEFLDFVLVNDAMQPIRTLSPDLDLRAALRVFLSTGADQLPVVDPEKPNQVLGVLQQSQIFAAYNAEILKRRLGVVQREKSKPES